MRSQQVNFPSGSSSGSRSSGGGTGRALAPQQVFDQTFADAATTDRAPLEDLLAIRVSGRPFALRLSEVAGLFADRTLTRLPTMVPELLGLMTVRGPLVPVYDLAALLGWPDATRPRWLVVAAGTRVGLAFDQLDGHLRIPSQAITAHEEANPARHVHEIAQLDDGRRPIISLSSVLDAIASRVRPDQAAGDAWSGGSGRR